MIILIDQDGVLANYEKHALDLFHLAHPEVPRLPAEKLVLFNTEDNYPEQYRKEIDQIALRPNFYRELEPFPGAIEAIRYMLDHGHDVRICTAPKRQAMPCIGEKYEWVLRHLGQDMLERMIGTRDKTLVRGDILIDDKPRIKGICKPEWEHILYDRIYNRHVEGTRRLDWTNYREILGI